MKFELSDRIKKYIDNKLKLIKSTTMNIEEAYVVGDEEDTFAEQQFLYVRYEDGSEVLRIYPTLAYAAGKDIKDDRLKNMQFQIYKKLRELDRKSYFSYRDLRSNFLNNNESVASKYFESKGMDTSYMVQSYYSVDMKEEDKKKLDRMKKYILSKCDSLGIKYETNPNIIIGNVLERIFNSPGVITKKAAELKDVTSNELLTSTVEKRLESCSSPKDYQNLADLIIGLEQEIAHRYTSTMISMDKLVYQALKTDSVSNKEQVLKDYAEYLMNKFTH